MRRKTQLCDRDIDRVLSRLSKDLRVDMREVLKLKEKYANSSVCYKLGDLSDYAHGEAVDDQIDGHLQDCEMCRGVVDMVRELSIDGGE